MASILNATTSSGLVTSADNSGSLQLATNNGTTAVTIDTSQNVGIGTASPVRQLHINNSASGQPATFQMSTANTGGTTGDGFSMSIDGTSSEVNIIQRENAAMLFYTNGTERMRINSSGALIIGKTVSTIGTVGIYMDGSGIIQATRSGDAVMNLNRISSNGTNISFRRDDAEVGSISVTTTATAYNTSSDYRLKENIAPMTGALARVSQLKPVTYSWKATGETSQGFIAHELQAVVPDCVTGEKDAMRTEKYEVSPAIPATFNEEGNELTPAVEAVMGEHEVPAYQGVDTSFLVATLTAAIQELKTELDATKAEVQALKGVA